MTPAIVKQPDRFRYLEALKEMLEESPEKGGAHGDVVKRAGLTPQEGDDARRNLLEDGLIEFQGPDGRLTISDQGSLAYQEAVRYLRDILGAATTIVQVNTGVGEAKISVDRAVPQADLAPKERRVSVFPESCRVDLSTLEKRKDQQLTVSSVDAGEFEDPPQPSTGKSMGSKLRRFKDSILHSVLEKIFRMLLSRWRGS